MKPQLFDCNSFPISMDARVVVTDPGMAMVRNEAATLHFGTVVGQSTRSGMVFVDLDGQTETSRYRPTQVLVLRKANGEYSYPV